MSSRPESLPAPRVMSFGAVTRDLGEIKSPLHSSDLVQLWATGWGDPFEGRDVVKVACSELGLKEHPLAEFSMFREAFEAAFPLSVLLSTPNDPSDLTGLTAALVEPAVESGRAEDRRSDRDASEAFQLMRRWASGAAPIRQTQIFLRRVVLSVPTELAAVHLEVCQALAARRLDAEMRTEIAGLCLAIGTVLNGDPR